MANRVEYIKIARIDQNGNDLTNTLESLTQLTIPYSNGNNAVYPIESITRRNEFFLYQVGQANYNPNPNDSGSLLYEFTGSIGGTTGGVPNDVVDASGIAAPFATINGTGPSVSFLYDAPNNRIQLGTYPEKSIHIRTGNFYVTCSAECFVELYKSDSNYTPSSITRLTNTTAILPGGNKGPFTREISISASCYPGDIFFLGATATTLPPSGPFVWTNGGTDGKGDYSPFRIFVTSSIASGPYIETVPQPFLPAQFYGTDCDVLLNNVNLYQENPFLQDLDYNSGPNTPTNFQLIISGTAARGTVPESYYTSLAQTTIRYIGSKNQSSDFNIYDPQAGTSSFGEPINVGTYGQIPSISNFDTNIYEFEWGGGTTPEILDWGAFKLGKILQVSSPDLVKTIDPSQGLKQVLVPSKRGTTSGRARNYRSVIGNSSGQQYPPQSVSTSSIAQGIGSENFWLTSQSISDYTHVLNSNNPVNHEISMFMYPNSTAGSNPTIPSTAKILDTDWGVPSKSSYALTSSNSVVYGTINSATSPRRFINLNRNVHISKVVTDNNGFYNSGQLTKPNWATIGDQINIDLNEGWRWFITLYNEFEFPNNQGDYNSALTSGSLSPFNPGIEPDSNGNFSEPLAYKGVYEIAGVYDNFSTDFGIMLYNDFPDFGGIKNIGGNTPGNSLGMLIWRARSVGKGEFVLVQNEVTGGIQAGGFISKYAPDYITENFESITKEYGANQTG